ncbi:MAG: hypothetical protein GEV07_09085 [Streptosporangiales bacterium]|nr:hypothetical protein [Streptosporangiales bacterium]
MAESAPEHVQARGCRGYGALVGHITVPYHLNEPIDPYPVSVPDGLAVKGPRPQGETWDAFVPLYTSIAQIVFGTENAVVWTGDCAVSLAVVAGLQRRGIDPAVVWIDAHADFNTPQTTVTGYLGGMPLAMLTQRGEVDLAMHIGMRAIPDDRVILAGPRDVDDAEQELLDISKLHRMRLDELAPQILPSGSVYLHVDLDILDPKELPGMRFATPGGASLDELAAAIESVTSSTRVVAVSFTFTLGEEQDPERTKAVSDRLLDALRRGGYHP